MMPSDFRFAANLGFLFKENGNLLNRYAAARQAGFHAVESPYPYEFPVEELVKAKEDAGLEQVLINAYTGGPLEVAKGIAAIPGREKDFLEYLQTSIKYAKALKCKKIHIMSGTQMQGIIDVGMMDIYEENMLTAVDLLEKEDLIGLIEPISEQAVPNYFLHSFKEGVRIIEKVNSPNLKLQVDLYHLQLQRGNITKSLEEWMPLIGHIQVAQVPRRNEPDTPGELDYRFIFNTLASLGYNGDVGLEYKPRLSTVEGLKWVNDFGFTL